jgi:hypothetical protein
MGCRLITDSSLVVQAFVTQELGDKTFFNFQIIHRNLCFDIASFYVLLN